MFARIRLIGSILSQMYFWSWRRSRIIPLIVAFVPTGIKIGVLTLIPLSVISQVLAFPFCFSILKLSFHIEYFL